MKRATVKARTNPTKYSREIAERVPYVEVPGWACVVAGEPCVLHRPLDERDGVPVEGDGGRYKTWSISHVASGAKVIGGVVNETREQLVERAERFVDERGGREKLREAAVAVIRERAAAEMAEGNRCVFCQGSGIVCDRFRGAGDPCPRH